jgi:hypothetical protein
VTRLDDASFPAGRYLLRARAFDQANNEASTIRRLDGAPMLVTLPIRIDSKLLVGVAKKRIVRRVVRRRGKRRVVRRRVTRLVGSTRLRFGRRARIAGRLTTPDGQGVAGTNIYVYARNGVLDNRLVGVAVTDPGGRFGYRALGSASRTLRFAYPGTALFLPASGEVHLRVPASSTIRVNHRRRLNGQRVRFSGRLRTLPVPAGGKLVELQAPFCVRARGRRCGASSWQTFRTTRTDQAGRWRVRYRFTRTCGRQRFKFRVRLPRESGYDFDTGASRSIRVSVRGRRCRG